MPSPLNIRIATPSDVEEVAALFIASQADALPFLAKLHSPQETRDFIANDVFQRCEVWVAHEGSTLVGMMALNDVHIDHLYLQPGHYRRRIGTKLLDKAKERRPQRLTLFAFAVNTRARAFYEHHAFTPIEFGDGSGNEAGEPDVLYEWKPLT